MRNIGLLAASACLLAACDSDTASYDSGDGSMTVETDDDGVTQGRITTDTGDRIDFTANDSEVELPFGFTIFPGGEVTQNASMTQGAGQGAMVGFTTEAPASDVIAHYRGEAETAGFEVSTISQSDGFEMLTGEQPDGEGSIIVMIAQDGASQEVTLTVGDGVR